MGKKLNVTDDYAVKILQTLTSMMNSDDEDDMVMKIYLDDLAKNNTLTEFFTALLLASRVLYCQISQDEDMDLLDFLALQNKLAFQYLKLSE